MTSHTRSYGSGGGISQTISTTPSADYIISIDVASRSGVAVTGQFKFGELLAVGFVDDLVPKQANSLRLPRGEAATFAGTPRPCPDQLAG